MQLGDLLRLGLPQANAQRIGKQGMVAVPAPLVIQRGNQHIGALQRLQHSLAFWLATYGIT